MSLPSFSLEHKVAFVTGAASGIGRRIAIGLAEAGADVGCFDLPTSDLSGVVSAIAATGRRGIACPGDVTSQDILLRSVEAVERDLGPLNVAVNCAGIANGGAAETMPLSQWQKVMDVNLTGTFLSCQAEGRAMLRNGGGAIVNIASISGRIVNRGLMQAHYNASKAGVAHLTRSLAMEWIGRGVRVNSISPGYTATPMNLRPDMTEQARRFEADTPLGRMASVDEMVGPAIFLLSEAGSFCTGLDMFVDGGITCW
jgi:NAD(P)-dependent dehydrogenase (short-subunit alcohol dehydrogenase family)